MNIPKAQYSLSKSDLEKIRTDIKKFSRSNVAKTIQVVAIDWSVIIGCFALVSFIPHFATYLLAMLVTSTRQTSLLVLMHDASHWRLAKSKKMNDLICNLFCAFPCFITSQSYRKNHLAHHAHFNTSQDPDWERKRPDPRWKFPKTKMDLLKLFLQDLSGKGFFFSLKVVRETSQRGKQAIAEGDKELKNVNRVHALYLLSFAGAFTYFGLCLDFFLLWFLPFMTLFPAFFRIRSMAEHFGLDDSKGFENEFHMSRNFHGPLWERFFFTPLNVGLHLDHHLFPSIPWFNLPKIHAKLEELESYRQHDRREGSIFGGKGPAAIADFDRKEGEKPIKSEETLIVSGETKLKVG